MLFSPLDQFDITPINFNPFTAFYGKLPFSTSNIVTAMLLVVLSVFYLF